MPAIYKVLDFFIKSFLTDFSTLFLNAGAHIQHHYFFNSKANKSQNKNPSWYVSHEEDPILEMLHIYDDILESLLAIKDYQIIVATGLSQSPHHKTTFYYRLKNHELFLKEFGINFEKVYPRMSRDFLITFKNKHDAEQAEKKLQSFEKRKKNLNLILNFFGIYLDETKNNCLYYKS